MTLQQSTALRSAIARHRNIVVVGGTGSGKTALLNALINEMAVCDIAERVVIIDDNSDLQGVSLNTVQHHTSPEVPATMLLKTALRMRADRILLGEVRGPETLDLLMAWNTGHEGGATTLHAHSALAGLERLKMLISMNRNAPSCIAWIGEGVHVVVHIARTRDGRRVQDILGVSGYADGHYLTTTL